jgi:hypothetical protein
MKPMVVVRWLDAQDHAEKWVDEKDAEEFGGVDCEVTSVGFLVRKTDKYVTLAGDWDAIDSDYGRVTKIPTKMIVEIKELS